MWTFIGISGGKTSHITEFILILNGWQVSNAASWNSDVTSRLLQRVFLASRS